MNKSQKIKTYFNLEDIIAEISKDAISEDILSNRYAVRFILLENFDLLKEFITRMGKEGFLTYDIENIFENDSWITKDELLNIIKQQNDQIIMYPVSEIVRFYPDNKFNSFFEESLLYEAKDKTSRIYIPLIGLRSRFDNFLLQYSRIEESQPIWSLEGAEKQPVIIYLTNNELAKNSKLNILETIKDWLKFWRTLAPTEKIICTSQTINDLHQFSVPDNILEFIQINNAFDFINDIYNINLQFEYKQEEEEFWNQLLNDCKNKIIDNFNVFVSNKLNLKRITEKNILNIWTDPISSEYIRWLLKNNYLLNITHENNESAKEGYLYSIINNCNDYSNYYLYKELALRIFDNIDNQNHIKERQELINLIDDKFNLPSDVINELETKIKKISSQSIGESIKLCIGRFEFEKIMLIGAYKNDKINIDKLKINYFDIKNYLTLDKTDYWIDKYIHEYKIAKLKDSYTKEIQGFISTKNKEENSFYSWYHYFIETEQELIKHQYDKIYWLDGVGIEYMQLILSIINKSNFNIIESKITKSKIPSSTEINAFENSIKKDNLDRFIHSEAYKHPVSIVKEIEIVKEIIYDIVNSSYQCTIAIVSDHGLTALSRLVDSKKYPQKASHEGRYIEVEDNNILNDGDYVRHEIYGKIYKVALTHASLNTKPQREVHGGCTPEEVLVPFIIISNKDKCKKNKVETNNENIGKEHINITKGFQEEELF